MPNGKIIILFVLTLINFAAFIYIYLLHQNILGIQGLECINELGITILIVPLLLIIVPFIKIKMQPVFILFFSILSLVTAIYVMAAHSGDRSAVSLFDQPVYIIATIVSVSIISINSYSNDKNN